VVNLQKRDVSKRRGANYSYDVRNRLTSETIAGRHAWNEWRGELRVRPSRERAQKTSTLPRYPGAEQLQRERRTQHDTGGPLRKSKGREREYHGVHRTGYVVRFRELSDPAGGVTNTYTKDWQSSWLSTDANTCSYSEPRPAFETGCGNETVVFSLGGGFLHGQY